jgi:hypothetical protein
VDAPLFERLTPGGVPAQFSGITLPTRTVVDDAARFETLWREAFASDGDSVAPPAVDWGREKVVIAALGNRPGGGYSIEITGVERVGDELRVIVETTIPGPGCMTTSALTQPLDAVRIPRNERGVLIRFIERERTRDCP